MAQEQTIQKIMETLYEYEEQLSDGYVYYNFDVDKTIRRLAQDIYTIVTDGNNNTQWDH